MTTPLCRNGHPRTPETIDCRNRCRECRRINAVAKKEIPARINWVEVAKERGFQQVCRVPPYRSGDRVRLRANGKTPADLAGKTVTVRSLVAAVVGRKRVVWRVCLEDGRSVTVEAVERLVDDGRAGER